MVTAALALARHAAQTGEQEAVELPEIDLVTIAGFVVVLVVAYLLTKAVSYVLTKVAERAVDHRIAVSMAIPMLSFLIYLGAFYIILDSVLDLRTPQLLALSGLLGAALGFGLKDLFGGVVGGIVILLERPYRVGDKIEILDHYGEVVGIGLRSTRIVTPDDDYVSIPNYVCFTEAVANANAGAPEMMVVTEFYVAQEADLERAVEIVEDAVITSRYIYVAEHAPFSVSTRDRPYYRLIRVRAYVNDHRHERSLISDVTDRVLATFEAEGIEKPAGIDVRDWDDQQ